MAAKKTSARTSKKVTSKVVKAPEKMVVSQKRMTWNKEQVIKTLRKPQILVPAAVLLAILAVYLLRSLFVVAIVNGQFITRPAFESALYAQSGKQVLNSLVTQRLLEQDAAKKGISVKQSDVDDQIKKIDQQLAAQGQTLDQALAAKGMSKANLEDQIRLQDLVQKLVVKDVKVSDKDVQDYMDKNKDSLPQGQSEDQLRASIKQQLEQEKFSTAFQSLVQKLQQQARITYFLNF